MFFGGGFPDFAHGHGGHREVDNNEFYELLGVDKNASQADIKKAYRKLAIKHHPDKGGDQEMFQKISEAYDVLGTPEKKDLYDKYGKEGLEQGGGMSSAEDVFSRFFGGGGRSRPSGPQKSKDLVHEIQVTLEELYTGKKRKLAVARKRATYPEGMSKDDAVSICNDCKGQGVQTRMQRVGPGMIQQFQVKCEKCSGNGKSYKPGVKIEKAKVVLEVFIEPGMKDGQKIVFSGEADELPGMLAGDVIFLLREQPHKLFKRKGADLLMEKEISLRQALCGFSFPVQHLDGKTVIIKRKPGEIIAPQALKGISDHGMPIHKRPFEHGRLFIFFKVEFPKTLTEKQCTLIGQALPTSTLDDVDMADMKKVAGEKKTDVETIETMMDMDPDDIGKVKASHSYNQAYDSDDEEEGGHQRGVQCQQS